MLSFFFFCHLSFVDERYINATFLVLLDLLASCQVPVPMEKEKLPPLGRWIPPPDLGNGGRIGKTFGLTKFHWQKKRQLNHVTAAFPAEKTLFGGKGSTLEFLFFFPGSLVY